MSHKSIISLLIFKNKTGKSFSINISETFLRWAVFSIAILLISIIGGIYFTYNKNIQHVAYNQLKKDYIKQQDILTVLNDKIDFFENDLSRLIEKEESLELLLGKAHIKKKKN